MSVSFSTDYYILGYGNSRVVLTIHIGCAIIYVYGYIYFIFIMRCHTSFPFFFIFRIVLIISGKPSINERIDVTIFSRREEGDGPIPECGSEGGIQAFGRNSILGSNLPRIGLRSNLWSPREIFTSCLYFMCQFYDLIL